MSSAGHSSGSSVFASPPAGGAPDVRIAASSDELASQLGAFVRAAAASAIAARGVFHVGVSGGSLPATLGKALTTGDSASLDLSKWHWWFADERCVPLASDDSNFAAVKKSVFDPLHVDPKLIHTIDEAKISQPKEAAAAYEATIRSVIPSGSLDLLLLGMGPDGHCCSLFPSHPLLKESHLWIASLTDSPKPPPARITMTYPLIERALASLFVITGDKADALRDVVAHRIAARGKEIAACSDEMLPAARVRSQEVTFLVDQAAAAKLPQANASQAQLHQQNKL